MKSSIISNHIFQDGNKRTGLQAALLFLRLNGFELNQNLSRVDDKNQLIPNEGKTRNEILYNFTIEVASGMLTIEQCAQWFKENIVSTLEQRI